MSKKNQKAQRHVSKRSKTREKAREAGREFGRELGKQEARENPGYHHSGSPAADHGKFKADQPPTSGKDLWLFGKHTVLAALKNPDRDIKRLLVTKRSAEQYLTEFSAINQEFRRLNPEIVLPEQLEKNLPADCVHQSIALLTSPLPNKQIAEYCEIKNDESHLLLILDKVTDPHNVGAIIRSAAAFGTRAIISTDRHSPPESGTLAKSASGALEIIPWIRVTNLSRALDDLAEMGYWRLGLDGTAALSIKEADFGKNIALVMGAEGRGLRKGTQSHCDALIKLPIQRTVESLNVSNAAAIALYEFSN